jgi:hypothetical protein
MYKIIGADGKEYGPVTAEQLHQWISEGRLNAQSQVLAEGAQQWKPLGQFRELAATLPGASLPSIGPVPASQMPQTNSMAVTGLILGIVSLPGLCCCYGLPFSLPGIVFSIMALSQIKKDPQHQQGQGMAIAGLVISGLSLLLAVVLLLLGIATSLPEIMKQLQRI